MAGTDSTFADTDSGDIARLMPAVILMQPQMGENIGASARAMKNCGLTELHIVSPRDGWPNPAAVSMAAGGEDILGNARLHESLAAATAPFTMIAATTARMRGMTKPAHHPDDAARVLADAAGAGGRAALLFGPERAGLDNDSVALADFIITVPLNPAFSSLNLGQAVLLMGWVMRREILMRQKDSVPATAADTNTDEPATAEEKQFFFAALEEHLIEGGFFTSPDMRPVVMRNIMAMFQRAGLSRQEVSTLHGVLKAVSRSGNKSS